MSNFIKEKFQTIRNHQTKQIRQKAITAAKARLIENSANIADLSDEEFEIVVQDEERKIKENLKTRALYGAGAIITGLFGLNLLG